ncbi:MAG: TIGR00725 family protein [Spirulinaceae cyanobacterium]
MSKIIIGVMGPGESATPTDLDWAYQIGHLIAAQGWILLTGGRNSGVMDAASRGARSRGGLTIGILPTNSVEAVSEAVDIAIATGMNQARNNINVLSSHGVIACGMGLGTASEVALALKNQKPVVLLHPEATAYDFFSKFTRDRLFWATSPEAALQQVKAIL